MNIYKIYKVNDTYTKEDYCCTVIAGNETGALKNYKKGLFNSGEKTIVYNDFRKEHELITSYGACFIARKEEEK